VRDSGWRDSYEKRDLWSEKEEKKQQFLTRSLGKWVPNLGKRYTAKNEGRKVWTDRARMGKVDGGYPSVKRQGNASNLLSRLIRRRKTISSTKSAEKDNTSVPNSGSVTSRNLVRRREGQAERSSRKNPKTPQNPGGGWGGSNLGK